MITVNRKEAKKRIFDAISKSLLAYDSASSAGKRNISLALTGLYDEYRVLTAQPNLAGEPYAALTAQIQASRSAIERVQADRNNLANALVTAAEIASAMAAVLSII